MTPLKPIPIPLVTSFADPYHAAFSFRRPLLVATQARRCRLFIDRVVDEILFTRLLLAQDGAAAAAGDGPMGSFMSPFVLPAGLLFLFYFIVIAPERRRKKDEVKLMSSLKKNDRVVTIGGIHAVVAAVTPDSDVITLRIDENGNTRIKVNRSAISRIVTEENTEKTKSDQSKDDGSDSKQ